MDGWSEAEAIAAWVEIAVVLFAALASTFVGFAAWRTSVRATKASEDAAAAAKAALDLEARRDEAARLARLNDTLREARRELVLARTDFMRFAVLQQVAHRGQGSTPDPVDRERVQLVHQLLHEARAASPSAQEQAALMIFATRVVDATQLSWRDGSFLLGAIPQAMMAWQENRIDLDGIDKLIDEIVADREVTFQWPWEMGEPTPEPH